jgi:Rrf2 family protein
MLKTSAASGWALIAINYLAKHAERIVSTQEIADECGASRHSLIKILQNLRRQGLVRATRGDGFSLARPAAQITILEVLKAVDGPLVLAEICLTGQPACSYATSCPLWDACQATREFIRRSLTETTFDRLPKGPTGCGVPVNGNPERSEAS